MIWTAWAAAGCHQGGQAFWRPAPGVPPLGKAWTPVAAELSLPLGGHVLPVEFLHTAKGLGGSELEENARELAWAGVRLRVQHPAHCLEGKLVNVCELDQAAPPRQDLKHARPATLALHAFVQDRLAAGQAREALGWIERTMRLAGRRHGLTLWYTLGLDVVEAVPLAALQPAAGDEKITNFLARRWDQLQTKLADQRAHFEAVARQQGRAPHPLQPLLDLHLPRPSALVPHRGGPGR